MKRLILIRGLSGSGKTTLASTICYDLNDRIMLSVDDYFIDDDGNYTFDPNAFKEAHEWCKKETLSAMEDEYEVIVIHNTFSRKWEVDPYMNLAHKNNYQVQVINLYDGGLSDRDLADRNVHNIPSYVIQKQRKRWDKDVYREKRNHFQQNGFNQNRYRQPQHNGYYQKRNPRW